MLVLFQKYVESSLGWSGERGEDSSYDSECEDESAHRAASRTPSDTLAAEFAEYVTLTPPQPNQVRHHLQSQKNPLSHVALCAKYQTLQPSSPAALFSLSLLLEPYVLHQ